MELTPYMKFEIFITHPLITSLIISILYILTGVMILLRISKIGEYGEHKFDTGDFFIMIVVWPLFIAARIIFLLYTIFYFIVKNILKALKIIIKRFSSIFLFSKRKQNKLALQELEKLRLNLSKGE